MPPVKIRNLSPIVTVSETRGDDATKDRRFLSDGEVAFQLPDGPRITIPFHGATNESEAIQQAAVKLEGYADSLLKWAQYLRGA